MNRFLLALPLSLVIGFSVNSTAFAASAFDTTLKTTNNLIVSNNVASVDVTTTYLSYVATSSNSNCSTVYAGIQNAVSNGGKWFVYQSETSSEKKVIMLYQTPNGNFGTNQFVDHPSYGKIIQWSYNATSPASRYAVQLIYQSGAVYPICYVNSTPGDILSMDYGTTHNKLFLSTFDTVYPSGYAGVSLPDQYLPPEDLKPDYNWSVSTDGKLKVEYLKNLPHFLTGISYLKIDKMTNNWAGLDSTLSTITVNPAGWLNEEYQLPSPGYYMFDVSHNQQLDQPPWPTDKSYTVKQTWVQFYWDGKSFVNGTTVGCTDGICNDFKDDKSKVDKLFSGISIPTHGLQAAITAPLTFWASLPSATSSCSALSINLPLLNRSITLPCLTASVYQPHFPALLALWQTATTGIVAYWLSIKLFGHIKDINSPDKDRIEVSHL